VIAAAMGYHSSRIRFNHDAARARAALPRHAQRAAFRRLWAACGSPALPGASPAGGARRPKARAGAEPAGAAAAASARRAGARSCGGGAGLDRAPSSDSGESAASGGPPAPIAAAGAAPSPQGRPGGAAPLAAAPAWLEARAAAAMAGAVSDALASRASAERGAVLPLGPKAPGAPPPSGFPLHPLLQALMAGAAEQSSCPNGLNEAWQQQQALLSQPQQPCPWQSQAPPPPPPPAAAPWPQTARWGGGAVPAQGAATSPRWDPFGCSANGTAPCRSPSTSGCSSESSLAHQLPATSRAAAAGGSQQHAPDTWAALSNLPAVALVGAWDLLSPPPLELFQPRQPQPQQLWDGPAAAPPAPAPAAFLLGAGAAAPPQLGSYFPDF
jgi:hypothetical protein